MKKTIFIACFSCICLTGIASEYEPMFKEERQWSWMVLNSLNSDSGGNLCTRVADVTVGSDTVIDGTTMKRLEINCSNECDVEFFGYDKQRKVYLRDGSGEEFLLFDFNAKLGDRINDYLTVTDEDEITVMGKEYRRLILNGGKTCWVEGIGCPDGCLSVIESPFSAPSDASIPHLAASYDGSTPFLNRDFYQGSSAVDVRVADWDDSDYKSFIVDGKAWVEASFSPSGSGLTETVVSQRITGEKKMIDGKECSVVDVNKVYPSPDYSEFCLYEADKKVWRVYVSHASNEAYWTLMYDFNLHKGDNFELINEFDENAGSVMVTEEDFVVAEGGVALRRLSFSNGMKWIEGFGGNGYATIQSLAPDCICFGSTVLGYYHRARLWEYQWQGAGISLAGLDNVIVLPCGDKIYDLLGRELKAEPAAGTFYISDGKVVRR